MMLVEDLKAYQGLQMLKYCFPVNVRIIKKKYIKEQDYQSTCQLLKGIWECLEY
jgi:hypothetical protein